MTAPAPYAPAPAIRTSSAVPLIGILLIAFADWLFTIELIVLSGGVDLGFTNDNIVYLLVRTGLVTTAVLAAGAITLGRRVFLVVVSIIVALHFLVTLGMAVVQIVLGARMEFVVESGILAGCLIAIGVAVVLGFVGSGSWGRNAVVGWIGPGLVVIASVAWTIAASLHLGGVHVTMEWLFILLDLAFVVLLVLAAGFMGTPNSIARYAASISCVLLAVWLIARLSEVLSGGILAVFLIVRVLLLLAAAVVGFFAARSRFNAPTAV